jgi:hypothetical protein
MLHAILNRDIALIQLIARSAHKSIGIEKQHTAQQLFKSEAMPIK